MLKYVWFVQDTTDTRVDVVYTTLKAAKANVKQTYDKGGIFVKVSNDLYRYQSRKKYAEPDCYIKQVPVIHTKRKPKTGQ